MFSSVIPVSILNGRQSSMIAFPSWMGKNSTHSKRARLLTQLHNHVALKYAVFYMRFYANYLTVPQHRRRHFNRIIWACSRIWWVPRLWVDRPMGFHRCWRYGDWLIWLIDWLIQTYTSYDLTREDGESIMELGMWPNSTNHMSKVDSKVKAALTRAYNKSQHCRAYHESVDVMAKGDRGAVD